MVISASTLLKSDFKNNLYQEHPHLLGVYQNYHFTLGLSHRVKRDIFINAFEITSSPMIRNSNKHLYVELSHLLLTAY